MIYVQKLSSISFACLEVLILLGVVPINYNFTPINFKKSRGYGILRTYLAVSPEITLITNWVNENRYHAFFVVVVKDQPLPH